MKKIVSTDSAPKPGGHYSQAVQAGSFIFVAGSVPVDPQTGEFVTVGIEAQTARTLENIRAILAASGASLEDVVKANVYLKNITDFTAFNTTYQRFFPKDPPARTTVGIDLAGDFLIEIDVIAHKD